MNILEERRWVLRFYTSLFVFLIAPKFAGLFMESGTRGVSIILGFWVFYCFIKLHINNNLFHYHNLTNAFIILFSTLSVSLVIRGKWQISNPIDFLRNLTAASDSILSTLLPIFILFLPNYKYKKSILRLFYKISLFAFPLWIISDHLVYVDQGEDVKEYYADNMIVGIGYIAAFLIGSIDEFTKKKQIAIVVIFTINFLLMIANGRRGTCMLLMMYLLISLLCGSKVRNKVGKYLTPLVFLVVFSLLSFSVGAEFVDDGPWGYLFSRINENTRDSVNAFFWEDFKNSPIQDWIFGRGMNGSYYHYHNNIETGEISYWRNGLETGYLNLLLKGGLIYVLFIFIFLITSIYKAFKYKKENFLFYGGILLTFLFCLYAKTTLLRINTLSIIFWFCISLTYQYNYYYKIKHLIRS